MWNKLATLSALSVISSLYVFSAPAKAESIMDPAVIYSVLELQEIIVPETVIGGKSISVEELTCVVPRDRALRKKMACFASYNGQVLKWMGDPAQYMFNALQRYGLKVTQKTDKVEISKVAHLQCVQYTPPVDGRAYSCQLMQ